MTGQGGLEQRAMRLEREVTSEALQGLASAVTVKEMTEHYQAEQAAIQRLYASGENELAFEREKVLTQMQIDAAIRIAEMEADAGFWDSFLGVIGDVASSVILR